MFALFSGMDDITDELFEKGKSFADFVYNREKSKEDKAAPHNGARRFIQSFDPSKRLENAGILDVLSIFHTAQLG